MPSLGWRTHLYFLLAGAIFVFSQAIVGGSRTAADRPAASQAGDRSYQDARALAVPSAAIETDGRGTRRN
jgi:hypothetical protein